MDECLSLLGGKYQQCFFTGKILDITFLVNVPCPILEPTQTNGASSWDLGFELIDSEVIAIHKVGDNSILELLGRHSEEIDRVDGAEKLLRLRDAHLDDFEVVGGEKKNRGMVAS